MKLLRGVTASFALLVGLITLAGGLYSLAVTWGVAAKTQQPLSLSTVAVGLIVSAIGFLFLIISRAIDPDHGPVLSYRMRRRKSQTHA